MRAGQAGGYGSTFLLMQSLGLLPAPQASAQTRVRLSPGGGTSVVILGAGIAGLAAAYELNNAGYKCVVLEAREHPGGRNWSIRGGTKIVFDDGTEQLCAFADGQYLNAGPARLASSHRTMLDYCRELAVPLEVEINVAHSALMQHARVNGGKPVERRQVENDIRGHVAELLGKAINRKALDQELTAEDQTRMLNFLSLYGDLDDSKFIGTDRSGYRIPPSALAPDPVKRDPIPLKELLQSNFWGSLMEEEEFGKQATMFQPIGGMDRIPVAFDARLGN